MIVFPLTNCSPSPTAQNSNSQLLGMYHRCIWHRLPFQRRLPNLSTVTKPYSKTRSDLFPRFPFSSHFNLAHTICFCETSHPFLTGHKITTSWRVPSSVTVPLWPLLSKVICSSCTLSIYVLHRSFGTFCAALVEDILCGSFAQISHTFIGLMPWLPSSLRGVTMCNKYLYLEQWEIHRPQNRFRMKSCGCPS